MSTSEDDAALIAEVRFYSAKARRVMEEINADPPQYVDYLDRLAAALERAHADAARMRSALRKIDGFSDYEPESAMIARAALESNQ